MLGAEGFDSRHAVLLALYPGVGLSMTLPKVTLKLRIFIVGVPRSGTTLMQSLLGAHSAVMSFTESHFFSKHFKRAWRSGPFVLRRNPVERVERFLTENALNPQTYERYVSSFRQLRLFPLHTTYAARLFIELLDEIAGNGEYPAWLEKTPKHLHRIDLIDRVTRPEGNARFIHVVRDGREVVASLYKASQKWHRGYPLEECIRRWNHDIRITLERASSKSDHVVFYEDLATTPEQVLRDLLVRLDLDWNPRISTAYPETAARVIAPGEEWKDRATEPIRLSRTFERTLSKSEQDFVSHELNFDLYTRLRDAVGQ